MMTETATTLADTVPGQGAAGVIVLRLLDAWQRLDLEAVMAHVAEDATFLPEPGGEAVRGHAAIRTLWARYMGLFASYSVEVRTMLSSDQLVLMERIERVARNDGQLIVIPVAAVFEVDADGKLLHWRDYWDPAVATPPAP